MGIKVYMNKNCPPIRLLICCFIKKNFSGGMEREEPGHRLMNRNMIE
jgi:hypothetical protein